ncbi:hypothetical protein BB560_003964 [Smittium megazygosporum]|uniref:HSF-type DNA-binding domain-containing protein n=1 Tax=Smittium megazygosporum TaxID=133381 RepID=A0A2T9ZAI7_9FUNG|nr:hypothetical protein BB560_003964 [Smittium megazygosporum]
MILEKPSSNVNQRIRVTGFLNKLYNLVDDPTTNDFIRWTENGESFLIFKHEDFAKEILPKFFKHNNFSSFVRQLNMYGFHKVPHLHQGVMVTDSSTQESWEFNNPYFVRNQPDLLHFVVRNNKSRTSKDEPAANNLIKQNQNSVPASSLIKNPSSLENDLTQQIFNLSKELESTKDHQVTLSTELKRLRRENALLWNEAAATSNRLIRQQEGVDKIIKFLSSIFSNEKQKSDIGNRGGYLLLENTPRKSGNSSLSPKSRSIASPRMFPKPKLNQTINVNLNSTSSLLDSNVLNSFGSSDILHDFTGKPSGDNSFFYPSKISVLDDDNKESSSLAHLDSYRGNQLIQGGTSNQGVGPILNNQNSLDLLLSKISNQSNIQSLDDGSRDSTPLDVPASSIVQLHSPPSEDANPKSTELNDAQSSPNDKKQGKKIIKNGGDLSSHKDKVPKPASQLMLPFKHYINTHDNLSIADKDLTDISQHSSSKVGDLHGTDPLFSNMANSNLQGKIINKNIAKFSPLNLLITAITTCTPEQFEIFVKLFQIFDMNNNFLPSLFLYLKTHGKSGLKQNIADIWSKPEFYRKIQVMNEKRFAYPELYSLLIRAANGKLDLKQNETLISQPKPAIPNPNLSFSSSSIPTDQRQLNIRTPISSSKNNENVANLSTDLFNLLSNETNSNDPNGSFNNTDFDFDGLENNDAFLKSISHNDSVPFQNNTGDINANLSNFEKSGNNLAALDADPDQQEKLNKIFDEFFNISDPSILNNSLSLNQSLEQSLEAILSQNASSGTSFVSNATKEPESNDQKSTDFSSNIKPSRKSSNDGSSQTPKKPKLINSNENDVDMSPGAALTPVYQPSSFLNVNTPNNDAILNPALDQNSGSLPLGNNLAAPNNDSDILSWIFPSNVPQNHLIEYTNDHIIPSGDVLSNKNLTSQLTGNNPQLDSLLMNSATPKSDNHLLNSNFGIFQNSSNPMVDANHPSLVDTSGLQDFSQLAGLGSLSNNSGALNSFDPLENNLGLEGLDIPDFELFSNYRDLKNTMLDPVNSLDISDHSFLLNTPPNLIHSTSGPNLNVTSDSLNMAIPGSSTFAPNSTILPKPPLVPSFTPDAINKDHQNILGNSAVNAILNNQFPIASKDIGSAPSSLLSSNFKSGSGPHIAPKPNSTNPVPTSLGKNLISTQDSVLAPKNKASTVPKNKKLQQPVSSSKSTFASSGAPKLAKK